MTTIKVITYPESREAFFEKQLKRAQRGLDNVVKYGTDPDACAEAGETVSFYQDALSALREQAERDKGCEYCTTEEQQNERGRVFYKEFPHDARFLTTLDDAHLQIAFDNQSGWVLHFEDDSGDRMFDVKIASCPMCGRRLEAQHE